MNTKTPTNGTNPNQFLLESDRPCVPAAFSRPPNQISERTVTFVWQVGPTTPTRPYIFQVVEGQVVNIPTHPSQRHGLYILNASDQVIAAVANLSGLGKHLIDHIKKLRESEVAQLRIDELEDLRSRAKEVGMQLVPITEE